MMTAAEATTPSRTAMMTAIHDAYFNGTEEEFFIIWDHQDGYGMPGFVPTQGYDWSGVRDSSDDAVATIWTLLQEARQR